MKALDPTERSAAARKAAQARWSRARGASSEKPPGPGAQNRKPAASTSDEDDAAGSYRAGTRVLMSFDLDVVVLLAKEIERLPRQTQKSVSLGPKGLELCFSRKKDLEIALREFFRIYRNTEEHRIREKKTA
jgi:hypothetical protein